MIKAENCINEICSEDSKDSKRTLETMHVYELKEFYSNYQLARMEESIESSILDPEYKHIRLMLNTVKRFIEITDQIACIQKPTDVMQVFLSVVCIEALFKQASLNTDDKYMEGCIKFIEINYDEI